MPGATGRDPQIRRGTATIPHLIRDSFLADRVRSGLLRWTLENRERFAASAIDRENQVRTDRRRSLSLRGAALDEWRDTLSKQFAAALPMAAQAIGQPVFPLARVELEIVAYGDGAFFSRHVDTYFGDQRTPSDRMISCVYYFHRMPRGFTDGALRLHAIDFGGGEANATLDVEPADNRLVAFPSWLPHEVLPVRSASDRFEDSRFAINAWLCRAR